jgi:hypothetical protein
MDSLPRDLDPKAIPWSRHPVLVTFSLVIVILVVYKPTEIKRDLVAGSQDKDETLSLFVVHT